MEIRVKILRKVPEYGKVKCLVELGPEDEGKTDEEIVTAVDNYGEYGKVAHHFGGSVERSGSKATVVVYTD